MQLYALEDLNSIKYYNFHTFIYKSSLNLYKFILQIYQKKMKTINK